MPSKMGNAQCWLRPVRCQILIIIMKLITSAGRELMTRNIVQFPATVSLHHDSSLQRIIRCDQTQGVLPARLGSKYDSSVVRVACAALAHTATEAALLS